MAIFTKCHISEIHGIKDFYYIRIGLEIYVEFSLGKWFCTVKKNIPVYSWIGVSKLNERQKVLNEIICFSLYLFVYLIYLIFIFFNVLLYLKYSFKILFKKITSRPQPDPESAFYRHLFFFIHCCRVFVPVDYCYRHRGQKWW